MKKLKADIDLYADLQSEANRGHFKKGTATYGLGNDYWVKLGRLFRDTVTMPTSEVRTSV